MQEIILEFLFGPEGIQKGLAPLAIAGIVQGVSSLIGAFSAGKQKRDARRAAARYNQDLARLQANRQEIIDPYAGVQDMSSLISNPFANLQVATQAAEMQAAETDISLASTLDTLRATGAGAGGATALAQAAARSKQGIAATIAQQEAQNARLRASGEQALQQARLGEARRVQQAQAAGQSFMFGVRESREMTELDRTQSMLDQQRIIEQQARQAQNQSIGQLAGVAASFGAQALGGTNPFTGNPMGGSAAGVTSSLGSASSYLPTNFSTGAAGGLSSSFANQYGGPFSSINLKYGNP